MSNTIVVDPIKLAKVKTAMDNKYENKQANKKTNISGDFTSDTISYPTVQAVKSWVGSEGFLKSHQDISSKADKTGGVAQVTDGNSANYTNIGALSSGSTQQAINNAINTSLGGKSSSNHVHGGISNDGKIGTDSGKVIVTTTNGELTASDWVSEADAITLALIAYGESL